MTYNSFADDYAIVTKYLQHPNPKIALQANVCKPLFDTFLEKEEIIKNQEAQAKELLESKLQISKKAHLNRLHLAEIESNNTMLAQNIVAKQQYKDSLNSIGYFEQESRVLVMKKAFSLLRQNYVNLFPKGMTIGGITAGITTVKQIIPMTVAFRKNEPTWDSNGALVDVYTNYSGYILPTGKSKLTIPASFIGQYLVMFFSGFQNPTPENPAENTSYFEIEAASNGYANLGNDFESIHLKIENNEFLFENFEVQRNFAFVIA